MERCAPTSPKNPRNGGTPGAVVPASATASSLDALVDGVHVVRAGDLVCEPSDLEWVVESLLPAEAVVIIAGSAKVAKKTLTAMHLGVTVARGEKFIGFETHQRRVLYVFMEDGRKRVARRLKELGVVAQENLDFFCVVAPGQIDRILEAVRAARERVLLIIDPFVRFGLEKGLKDENCAAEIERLFAPLRDFAQKTGSTVVIVHHYRKQGDAMRGSVAFQGSSDGWLSIQSAGKDKTLVEWTLRDAEDGAVGIQFTFTGSSVSLERVAVASAAESVTTLQRDIEAIREFMRAHAGQRWSQTKLADQLFGGERNRARKALAALEVSRELRRPGGEKGGYEATPKLLEEAIDLD